MISQKKSHSHVMLIIIICVIIVFIVTPIALLFGLVFDNHTKNVHMDSTVTSENVGKRIMVDAFDKTEKEETVNLILTEDDFDKLLYLAQEKVSLGSAGSYVKKFYTMISGNDYDFYIDLQAAFFKTRLILRTTFNTSVANRIELKIKHINIGRLKVGMDLVNNFTGGYDLQKIFSESGLKNATFDKETSTLIYEVDGLIKDVVDMMGNAKDIDFMVEMMQELARLEKIKVVSESQLNIGLDLSSFDVRDNEYYDETFVNLSRDIKGVVSDEISKEVLSKTIEEKDVKAKFKEIYVKEFVETEPHDYKVAEKITEKFKNSATDYLAEPPVPITFTMNEEELNEYLGGISLMGETYTVSRYVDSSRYKIAYMTFDNFYCKIDENALIFVMTMNVNGFPLVVDFIASDVNPEAHEFGKITLKIDEIKLGDTAVSETFEERLYKFMYDSLKNKSSDTCLVMDEERNLVFNFVEPIQKGLYQYADEHGVPREKVELSDEKTIAEAQLSSDHTLKLDVIRKDTVLP